MREHLESESACGWSPGIPTCRTWAERRNPQRILKRSLGTPNMVKEGLGRAP